MLAVIGITAGKGTTPSCDPYGTFLRTEGCNDIFADGCCGEYSQDNGSCSCDGCDPYGTLQSTGTGTAWSNTIDADGTDWNINYQDCQYNDGCCGTYSERHWFAFFDTSPVELSSPDDGVSPNPPAGYALVASAIYPTEQDGNTYATYGEDPMWLTPMFATEESNRPWYSYEVLADGSGGSYGSQTVQPVDTVMSNPFIWMFNGKYVRYYSTGNTYDDSTNGTHPLFEILPCPESGTHIETLATGLDWNIVITLESLGTPYNLRVGTYDVISVTDGACGAESVAENFTPEPADTLLYDETISSYYYYSDGAGGYYSTFYG